MTIWSDTRSVVSSLRLRRALGPAKDSPGTGAVSTSSCALRVLNVEIAAAPGGLSVIERHATGGD